MGKARRTGPSPPPPGQPGSKPCCCKGTARGPGRPSTPAPGRLAAASLLLALMLPLLAGLVPTAAASGHEVVVARIDGVVDRGTSRYMEDALETATDRGVPLVIELDTPGGLVDATLEIDRMLADASVPVLTYVGPGGGAFAASAGTFILLMGQPSGMADGATIGSAQPIQVGPGGGSQNASAKVENFLVERIRSIAERTDRDPDTAERYVTENLNQEADTAVAAGMVDVKADTLREFLVAVDGMTADTRSGPVTLATADADVVRVEPGLLPDLISLLSDPTLASILLLIGVYSLIFGLANPGTFVPETVGAILLVLGLVGLGLFGATTAGILLLLLAVIFLVAEALTPSHGLFTAAGVITLVLAVVFLLDDPLLPRDLLRNFLFVGYTLAAVSGAIVFAVVTVAMKTRGQPVPDRSIGDRGTAMEALDLEGPVEVWGEVWNARATEPVEAGAPVRVVGRDGMTLTVAPLSGDEEE